SLRHRVIHRNDRRAGARPHTARPGDRGHRGPLRRAEARPHAGTRGEPAPDAGPPGWTGGRGRRGAAGLASAPSAAGERRLGWGAARGPRALRMAGGVADGVFIRAGPHRANIARSVDATRAGALAAGRDPSSVRIAAVFHTVFVDDPARALLMGKPMAAGYYEY